MPDSTPIPETAPAEAAPAFDVELWDAMPYYVTQADYREHIQPELLAIIAQRVHAALASEPGLTADGSENSCTHASASGVDAAPIGPGKRWRCDHCGLRWTEDASRPATAPDRRGGGTGAGRDGDPASTEATPWVNGSVDCPEDPAQATPSTPAPSPGAGLSEEEHNGFGEIAGRIPWETMVFTEWAVGEILAARTAPLLARAEAAEAERDAARGEGGGGRFMSQAEWSEWSNTLARLVPEEYEDDIAQEAIIERALTELVARLAAVEADRGMLIAAHQKEVRFAQQNYDNWQTAIAERDAALAVVGRVEALPDAWWCGDDTCDGDCSPCSYSADLRRALAGEA